MSIRSGPCAPFLLLSAAASRLLVSFLYVGVPVFVLCPAPPCAAPLSSFRLPLVWVRSLLFGSSLSFGRLSRVSSALRCSGLLPSAEFVFAFLGATQLLWSVAVPPPPPCVWSLFGFCASVCRGFVSWLCVGGPLSWLLWGCLFGEVGPARSHGLDCTAASFTGADQWSSLPCCPERPRAAKPAHMVRSVRTQRHCGYGTL